MRVESLLVSECHEICLVAGNEVETVVEAGAHDTLQGRRHAAQFENIMQVCAFAQLVRLHYTEFHGFLWAHFLCLDDVHLSCWVRRELVNCFFRG